MGTLPDARGAPLDDCFDALNLTRPQLVQELHLAYIHAGADIIETNTFGANRFKLEAFGLEDKARAINMRAVNIARDAERLAGREVLIAGAIGPTGRTLAPIGTVDPADVRARLRAYRDHGVVVIGANCSTGPSDVLSVARTMLRRLDGQPDGRAGSGAPPLYVSGQPNAGWPHNHDGRVIYPSSPEYFAGFARDLAEAGGRIIGGCCGTTPDHTRAMRAALDEWRREKALAAQREAARAANNSAPTITVPEAPQERRESPARTI